MAGGALGRASGRAGRQDSGETPALTPRSFAANPILTGVASIGERLDSGISQCTGGDAVPGLVAAGLITLGVGVVVGTVLVLRHDDTALQVVPATGALPVHGTWSVRPSAVNGLALRVAF